MNQPDPTRTDGSDQHYEPIYGELVRIGTDADGLTRAIVKIDRAQLEALRHLPMYQPVVITATVAAQQGDKSLNKPDAYQEWQKSQPSAAAPVSSTVEQRHRELSSRFRLTDGRHGFVLSENEAAQLLADFEALAVAEATAELKKELQQSQYNVRDLTSRLINL